MEAPRRPWGDVKRTNPCRQLGASLCGQPCSQCPFPPGEGLGFLRERGTRLWVSGLGGRFHPCVLHDETGEVPAPPTLGSEASKRV